MDKKGLIVSILAGKGRKKSDEESNSDSDEALVMAEEILAAIKDDDAEALKDALLMFKAVE